MAKQAERYRGSDGQIRRVFRTGPDDASPILLPSQRSVLACHLCELGFTHSQNAHDESANAAQ